MDTLKAKLQEFKNLPLKNKVAIALMLILSIAVIIKYYPSSNTSSMQLSSSANKVKLTETDTKAPNSSDIKATKAALEVLRKQKDGIYLTKKFTEADWKNLAETSQIILTEIKPDKNSWNLTGTGDNLPKLQNFVNNALKQGMQPIKANFELIEKTWHLTCSFKSIND